MALSDLVHRPALTVTNKRVGAPPFNRPVWTEGGKDYTVCGVCNRLWRPHLGPVCNDCKKAHQKAKADRRRQRRRGRRAA